MKAVTLPFSLLPSLRLALTVAALFPLGFQSAQAVTRTWDGGGGDITDLGAAANWSDDTLPSVANGDTAEWNGTFPGQLSLLYSTAVFAGAAGNPGINLHLTSAQTESLNIDAGVNTSGFRLNAITLDAGAGPLTLGNGANVFNITMGGAGGQTHTWTNNSSFAATISSEVALNRGGAGIHTLVLTGSGDWILNNNITDVDAANSWIVTKSGTGIATLTGANAYKNATNVNAGALLFTGTNNLIGGFNVNGGTLQFSGPTGVNNGNSAYSLNSGTMVIDNSSAAGGNNNVRINDASAFNLNGGTFVYKGSDAVNSTETIGALNGVGNSVMTISAGPGFTAQVTAASIGLLSTSATVLVNGDGLGSSATAPNRLIVTAAPALVGTSDALTTGINPAVQNTKIVPTLVGESASESGGVGSTTGVANTFLTYVAGSGLRPLNPTDEFTHNTIVEGNNTYITGLSQSSTTAAINSLVINGGNLIVDDATTLTNSSGALLFVTSNSINPTGTTGALTFGAAGKITVNSGVTGTIGTTISGTQTLTKGGAGTLVLSGANTYTGQTNLAGGTLRLTNPAAMGGTSTLNFTATSGTVLDIATDGGDTAFKTNSSTTFGTTMILNRATPGAALDRTLGIATYGGGTLTVTKGANVTSGTPSVSFPSLLLSAGTVQTTTFNPIDTTVSIGTVANSSTLAHTLGLGGTTAGNAVTGVISNGTTAVLSLQKTGTSTWALGGANTYTGTTAVSAGTLLVNGSHTGGGAYTVASGGTLGGSGSISAATTIATGGSLLGGTGAASGALSFTGNVTFNDGAAIKLTLGSAGAHSSLARSATGTWVFDLDQAFTFTSLGATDGSTYDNIISGLAGNETGLATIGTWTITNAGWVGTFSYDGNGGVDLALSTVPEPSTYVLFLGGLGLLFSLRRFRKSLQ